MKVGMLFLMLLCFAGSGLPYLNFINCFGQNEGPSSERDVPDEWELFEHFKEYSVSRDVENMRSLAENYAYFPRYALEDVLQRLDVDTARFIVREFPDSVNAQGFSPLHKAVRDGILPDITFLLKHGARVNAKNEVGETPLHIAARKAAGCDIFKVLVSSGADVNAQTPDGNTPLDLLGWAEINVLTVQCLVELGASVNTERGRSPLDTAVSYNVDPEIITYLLHQGADPYSNQETRDTLRTKYPEIWKSIEKPLREALTSVLPEDLARLQLEISG